MSAQEERLKPERRKNRDGDGDGDEEDKDREAETSAKRARLSSHARAAGGTLHESAAVPWTRGWQAGAVALCFQGCGVSQALADLIGDYCSPESVSFTFEFKQLFGNTATLVFSGAECVGHVFARYMREGDPGPGEYSSFAQLQDMLPHLHTPLAFLPKPLPSALLILGSLNPMPSWMRTRYVVAAFEAKVSWPPWRQACYIPRTCHSTREQLSKFACDPFNGEILGSWNAFGQGRTDVSGARNNELANLVGITEPRDPLLATICASLPEGERVLWINRHGFLAQGVSSFSSDDVAERRGALTRQECMRVAIARPLAIVNGTTGEVDESFSRAFAQCS